MRLPWLLITFNRLPLPRYPTSFFIRGGEMGARACGSRMVRKRGGVGAVMDKVLGVRGQGSLEAAFVIPVLFLLMLLLLQPGIVLYDKTVMGAAAAEGCRLLATRTDDYGSMERSCEAFIRHRLAAVPGHDCFHVHEGGCSWVIEFAGSETDESVTVRIENELRPLPLFDGASRLLGLTNGRGNLVVVEEVTMATQPAWASRADGGLAPREWIGAWDED